MKEATQGENLHFNRTRLELKLEASLAAKEWSDDFNRTRLELKPGAVRYAHGLGLLQPYQIGIETRRRPGVVRGHKDFNRTRLELKLSCTYRLCAWKMDFNRTRLELKQKSRVCVCPEPAYFNRTRLELKPVDDPVSFEATRTSTVPDWN